jgi:hypothetical protein
LERCPRSPLSGTLSGIVTLSKAAFVSIIWRLVLAEKPLTPRRRLISVIGALVLAACGRGELRPPRPPNMTAAMTRDLQGAIDIHIHTAPDRIPRSLDAFQAARLAEETGMRGIVLKNHYDQTAGLAGLAANAAPGVAVFAGIALNLPAGGMNVHAIRHFALMNGRRPGIVWMPTFDAENQIRSRQSDAPFVQVSRDGALLSETKDVIAEIARHHLVLASGHVSADEALLMFEEGRKLGIHGMLATHGLTPPTSLSIEQAQRAAGLGAFIEFTGGAPGALRGKAKIDRIADQIRKVGVSHAILSTDLGQRGNPLPAEGLATFMDALRRRGFTDRELDRMTKDNPAQLLGLD